MLYPLMQLAPNVTLMAPLYRLGQEVPLPADILAVIAAVVQLGAAIYAVIVLTGLEKFLAEKMGITLTKNQVRAGTALAAVVVSLLTGLVSGGIPGVGAMPATTDPQEWTGWLLKSALALGLFANAVWKLVYKPDPEVTAPPAEPPLPIPPSMR